MGDLRLMRFIFILLIILGLVSCSPQRSGIISKTYHNITAKFNAYFYARERMGEVDADIEKSHRNNFDKILHVFSDIDSAVIQSDRSLLDDCIRKASIAIQRHPNSIWVDDSYTLIGKARYDQGDFINAIETFKYVNTKSKEDDTRHEALIYLMRAFIDHGEINNAIAVSDYLKKENLNSVNKKRLALTRAYFYQRSEDYDNMIRHLVEAAPYLTKTDNKDRILFIIGQVYQLKGFDAEAYNYYQECLNSNPSFEMSFYARLSIAQVTQLTEEQDIKKVRKYFRVLLKDRKNNEFRDKIYYEMANFEKKQDNLDEAINFYKLSIMTSINNPRQKAYSYLRLGEIYFDVQKEYELAKAYYDSVVMSLPKEDEIYNKVAQRQEVLSDFVLQINTIQEQDSLLNLASMDSISLYGMLDDIITEEMERAKETEKQNLKAGAANNYQTNVFQPFNNNQGLANTGGTGATWYFYNLTAVGIGQSEFRRIWGDRKLTDHWRRSRQDQSVVYENEDIDPESLIEDNSGKSGQEFDLEGQRNLYLSRIPFTEVAKIEAHQKIELAYFKLGNIYNFQLSEKKDAAETFEILLERYPNSPYEAETRYQLSLIYQELGLTDQKKINDDRLIAKYPNSIYAKLLVNPNYREESNLASEKLKAIYKRAFHLFENDSLEVSLRLLQEGMELYPDNEFSDNAKLLEIFIIGKMEGIYRYQYELQEFKKNYPESELIAYTENLIKTTEDFQLETVKGKEIQFIPYFEQEHYFVVIYPKKEELINNIPKAIEAFNGQNDNLYNLKIGNLIFNDDYSMVLVNEFGQMNEAVSYYKNFLQKEVVKLTDPTTKIYNFVITKDNFQILYQTKGINDYLEFFRKNY